MRAKARSRLPGRKARPRGRLRRLARDQKGQSAVEFVLVVPLMVMIFLVIVSTFFLGMDLLMTRYGAFVGARAVLSGDSLWEEGPKAIGNMLFNVDRQGSEPVQAAKICGGSGVSLRVRIREFIPSDPLFGGDRTMQLKRECCMGRPPFEPSGDNQKWVDWSDVKARPLNFPQDR